MKQPLILGLSVLSLAMLTACGGGSSSAPFEGATTSSVSGKVADGYLRGATVCLDMNDNAVCDANEPTTITGSGGAFTLEKIAGGDESKYPLLVEVHATAVDEDTMAPVGLSYMLSAPAGQYAFISPLSTLVHLQMQSSGQNALEAMQAVQSELKLTVDLTHDYIAMQKSTLGEDQLEYVAAHQTAQALVRTMQQNLAALGNVADQEKKAVMQQIATMAKQAIASQGGDIFTESTFGIETPNTLQATVASKLSSSSSATQAVSISFDLVHAGMPIRCGDAININHPEYDPVTKVARDPNVSKDTTGQMIDTRFFVSNLMMTKVDGTLAPVYLDASAMQYQNVAQIDFGYNTASSGVACSVDYNMNITGMVEPGDYTGIQLTVGVPIRSADLIVKLNHTDRTYDPDREAITSPGMNWSWQGGRKFIKLEFMPDDPVIKVNGSTTTKWNVHLGSTGCVGDPTIAGNETACTNANRLDLNFTDFDERTQKVVLDVGGLFAKSDVSFDGGGAAGCMSSVTDPECLAIFETLGIDAENGRSLVGEQQQTVFSVVAK